MSFEEDEFGGSGMLDDAIPDLSLEAANEEEVNWDMPVGAGDLSDLSSATFSRVMSWNSAGEQVPGDAGSALRPPGLDVSGMLDSLTMPEAPNSNGSRRSALLQQQPFSGGSGGERLLGLPDPPLSSGSLGAEGIAPGAEAPGRQGGIWEVDALTIPSMCGQNVRVGGEWGSNIMGGSWGRNLVLPGLADLSGEPLDTGPSPTSTLRSSPFSFGAGPAGEGVDDELAKLRRERAQLETKLRDMSAPPEVSPGTAEALPPIPTFRRHKSHPPAKAPVQHAAPKQRAAEDASAASKASTAGEGAGRGGGGGLSGTVPEEEAGGKGKGKGRGGVGEDGWEAAKGRTARRRSSMDDKKSRRDIIEADPNPFSVGGEEGELGTEGRADGKGAGRSVVVKSEVGRRAGGEAAKNGSTAVQKERDVSKQSASPKSKTKEGGGKKEVGGRKGGQRESKRERTRRMEEEEQEEEQEEEEEEGEGWTVSFFAWHFLIIISYLLALVVVTQPILRLLMALSYSYVTQCPSLLWDALERCADAVRQRFGGLFVAEAQIAAAISRGGQRRRVRGDGRRWRVSMSFRMVAWAAVLVAVSVLVHLLFNEVHLSRDDKGVPLSRLQLPTPPATQGSEADRVCAEAQVLEAKEEWSAVQERLELALKIDANNTCALYNFGRLLQYHWNSPDKAEAMYLRALQTNGRHVPTLRNLGYLLLSLRRNISTAETMFATALQHNPKEIDVLSGYGSLLLDAHNYPRAEHFFQRALKVRPTHVHSMHKYGRILLYVQGDAVAAEKHFKTALDNAPHHLPVLIDYTQMLLSFWKQLGMSRRKSVDRAVEVLDRIVQINHNHIHALHLLAVIEHFIRQRPVKAERYYRRVLDKSPKHLPSLPKYGTLLLDMGRVDQAEELFRRMLEVEPKNPPLDGLVHYGHLLRVHRHNNQQAAFMYKRALRTRPTKSVPMSPDDNTRCWLCTNSSSIKVAGLCCGRSTVVVEDQWWLEPALWQPDAAKIDFDQNLRPDPAPRRA